MKNDLEILTQPQALPLIRAIATEIRERCLRILFLQTLLDTESVRVRESQRRLLVAEVGTSRRGLRLARAEMEKIGYSVVSMDPLRVCVRDSQREDSDAPLIELGSYLDLRES